jgi:CPA2 family monovalent cation:H+ antiporter-2
MGATQVLPEEFETAIELFERVLNKFLMPRDEIEIAIAGIRKNNYGMVRDPKKPPRRSLVKSLPNIEVAAIKVTENSPILNKSLSEISFRATYGVTVVAIKRKDKIMDHPDATSLFKNEDVVYILGNHEQIAKAVQLFELTDIEKNTK